MRKFTRFGACLGGFMALGLSACDGVNRPFQPQALQWSQAGGSHTLLLQAYSLDKRGTKLVCDQVTTKAYLMPDDPYFRDWMRVATSSNTYKLDLKPEARAYLHVAERHPGCLFRFDNLPVGHWLVALRMQYRYPEGYHHAVTEILSNSPNREAWVADSPEAPLTAKIPYHDLKVMHGTFLGYTVSSPEVIWGAVTTEADQPVLARSLLIEQKKQSFRKVFAPPHFGDAGEVIPWQPSEDERRQLEEAPEMTSP